MNSSINVTESTLDLVRSREADLLLFTLPSGRPRGRFSWIVASGSASGGALTASGGDKARFLLLDLGGVALRGRSDEESLEALALRILAVRLRSLVS